MLSDAEYLYKIVESVKIVAEATIEYIVGVKNTDSEHLYASPYLLKLSGLEQLPAKFQASFWPHYAFESIRQDDIWIIQKRKNKSFLVVDKFGGTIIPRIFVKRALINPFTDNVIGIIYQSFDYAQFNLSHEISKLFGKQQDDINDTLLSNLKLGRRQKQVIFFFLSNLNSHEIADFISAIENKPVTKSTIDSIFSEQLYIKFNVTSRGALRQKLLALGYGNMIPKDIVVPLVSQIPSSMLL